MTEEETTVETDKKCAKRYNCFTNFILKNLIPIFLVSAVLLGAFVPQIGMMINHTATKFVCVALMFLYSGLYLQTSAIKEAIKSYRAWIWGIVSILAVTSITSGQLTLLLPLNGMSGNKTVATTAVDSKAQSFRTGLLLYFCAPCTVSSGILMVTQLEGNYALAVMLTVVTNIVAIFTSPLLLKWLLSTNAHIEMDLGSILLKLCLSVLLPLIIGKIIQYIRVVREFSVVPRHKLCLKIINITSLSIIIMVTVAKSSHDGSLKELTVADFFTLVGWGLLMHTMWMIINTVACFLLRIKKAETKCIVILASQKTAAVSIAVLAFLPTELGNKGLMAVAIVPPHVTILLADSIILSLWLCVEKRRNKTQQNEEDKRTKGKHNNGGRENNAVELQGAA